MNASDVLQAFCEGSSNDGGLERDALIKTWVALVGALKPHREYMPLSPVEVRQAVVVVAKLADALDKAHWRNPVHLRLADANERLPYAEREAKPFVIPLGTIPRAVSGRRIERGSVYCAQRKSGGPIKIGYSTDVDRRMCSLSGSGSEPVVLLAYFFTHRFVEGALHRRLKEHRVHCEWFADVPEVRAVVNDLKGACRAAERARRNDCVVDEVASREEHFIRFPTEAS